MQEISRARLKGLWMEAMWTFRFYEAMFMEHEFVVLEQKKDKNCTPMQLEQFANRLQGHFEKTNDKPGKYKKPYYEMRKGTRLIFPKHQQFFSALFLLQGITEPHPFD